MAKLLVTLCLISMGIILLLITLGDITILWTMRQYKKKSEVK